MPDVFRDVIVVVPGILGSRLVRNEGSKEVTVWDLSIGGLPKALASLFTGKVKLDDPIGEPDDGVVAKELFSYQWLPGFFGVDDYAPLLSQLRKIVPNPLQLVEFPYDWRASNRHAAARLEKVAMQALATWREACRSDEPRLWLVAHSMGGLVSRFFCEHLGGAEYTRAIVTFGTPHRGAAKALGALSNGVKLGPLDLTSLVRSLPSAYELLPLYKSVRVPSAHVLQMQRVADFFGLSGETGEEQKASETLRPLVGLDRDMLKRSLQFHAAIRGPAEARVREGRATPYVQEAFFNRRQVTPTSAVLAGGVLTIVDTYPVLRNGAVVNEMYRGDGTVPSFSSTPIEWNDTQFAHALTDKHAAMQCQETGLDTLLNLLQPIATDAMKGPSSNDLNEVALELPTAIAQGDYIPVKLSARVASTVTVTLTRPDGSQPSTQVALLPGDDEHALVEFKPREAGAWRVTAQQDVPLQPSVSDWVYIFEP